METPQNLHHSALLAVDAAAAAYRNGCVGVTRAVELGLRHGVSGDEIRGRFELAGVDFPDQLAALETGVE